VYYSNKSALQSLLRVRAAPTRPHNPFIIRAIIDEYLRAYVVPCLIVWSLPCLRHILSHPHIHAHNSARAACAFEGAAGQRATRARSAEGERTWIVLRDRAEARSKVGKSIAERSGEPNAHRSQSTRCGVQLTEHVVSEEEVVGSETGRRDVVGPHIRRDEVRRGWEHGPAIHISSARTSTKISAFVQHAHSKSWKERMPCARLDPTAMRVRALVRFSCRTRAELVRCLNKTAAHAVP
jgi:hypothetical protein